MTNGQHTNNASGGSGNGGVNQVLEHHDAPDMEIDILHIQDTVTVEPDGTIVFREMLDPTYPAALRAVDGSASGAQLQVNQCKVFHIYIQKYMCDGRGLYLLDMFESCLEAIYIFKCILLCSLLRDHRRVPHRRSQWTRCGGVKISILTSAS